MTAPATCTISGTVYTGGCAALEGALVKIRVLPYASAENYLLEYPPDDTILTTSTKTQKVETNSSGVWSITVPQGAVILVEIAEEGTMAVGTVPTASTATYPADLGLYRVKA